MFKLDTSEAKAFAKTLEKMGKTALPKATARTLNAVARGANAQQLKNIRSKLTVRTPYTEKSLKMYSASESKAIDRQNAVVGSVSDYLPLQEENTTIRAKKRSIPIPTDAVRGADRKKKIAQRYRMNNLGDLGAKGGKAFMIGSGIYIRKKKKMIKIRDVSKRAIKIKGTHWHSEAVHKYAKRHTIDAVFTREAKKVIAELGAK